jgi:hypothetical protein
LSCKLVQSNKEIKTLSRKSNNRENALTQQIQDLQNKIEGLQNIIEGLQQNFVGPIIGRVMNAFFLLFGQKKLTHFFS